MLKLSPFIYATVRFWSLLLSAHSIRDELDVQIIWELLTPGSSSHSFATCKKIIKMNVFVKSMKMHIRNFRKS